MVLGCLNLYVCNSLVSCLCYDHDSLFVEVVSKDFNLKLKIFLVQVISEDFNSRLKKAHRF